jgi:hypothetical protein
MRGEDGCLFVLASTLLVPLSVQYDNAAQACDLVCTVND